MKVLFLHPNFPAQFKHIARAFAINNHETRFLCQTHYGRTIQGVERITLKNAAGSKELNKLKLNVFDRSQKLAFQFRQGMAALKKQGWHPDLIICHTGWGCGVHAKEIWPNTKIISYLEWWFNPESDFFHYDTSNEYLGINEDSIPKCWIRNQQIALELATSTAIIAPTEWQKNQLPSTFKYKCNVVFDGIDTDKFSPRGKVLRQNIITYGTRGMDAMRCFPNLINEMVQVLKENTIVTLEIAGENQSFYGSNPPNSSWKDWAISKLKNENLENRVVWLGKLPLTKYEKWITTSPCHLYFTHPFVASWSLVEAYCSGVPIIASDVKPVNEICENKVGVTFVDHRTRGAIAESVLSATSHSSYHIERDTRKYGIENTLEGWGDVAGVKLATLN